LEPDVKTTIMVVGLLSGQASKVERTCRYFGVRLKFQDGRHNGGIRGSADHCIVMVKFVDHGHTEKALRQFDRGRVHYNRGGLNELVETIAGISTGAITTGARTPTRRPQ
jgi:hypothetical protein